MAIHKTEQKEFQKLSYGIIVFLFAFTAIAIFGLDKAFKNQRAYHE